VTDRSKPDRERLERLLARSEASPPDPYLERFLGHRARRSKIVALPDDAEAAERVNITYLGEKTVAAPPMQTILETSCANGIPHVSECGGRARCSTCRVMIVDGLEHCEPRNAPEERLAARKGFYPEIRLACQTRVRGDVTLKPWCATRPTSRWRWPARSVTPARRSWARCCSRTCGASPPSPRATCPTT